MRKDTDRRSSAASDHPSSTTLSADRSLASVSDRTRVRSGTASPPLPSSSVPSREERERLYAALAWDMAPEAIEAESFRRIENLCAKERESLLRSFRGDEVSARAAWRVVRRLVHTTADPGVAKDVAFAHNAIPSGLAALKGGCRIVCDSNMIRAGLSLPRLRRCNPAWSEDNLVCHVADPDVAERARACGHTRALCAMDKARHLNELEGAIVLVGNAPLALATLCRYVLEEGVRPSLVVGMPVGFVNVREAKELLAATPVPQIRLDGNRGGSPLAVATLHALLETVFEPDAPETRPGTQARP